MTLQSPPTARQTRSPAEVAYRRSWLSLLLYPATFVAAFVIGEGLIGMLGYTDQQTPPVWAVLVAGVPALTVFVLPGALAAVFGRRALALGKREALAPVIVGATIGGGFVLVNLVSFALTRLFG